VIAGVFTNRLFYITHNLTKKSMKPTERVVAVSGGFDPVHIGHVRMFEAAKRKINVEKKPR